ncbi:MAG: DUF2182 domain-containing protein, partial [Mesorhizobium sp.]
MSDTALEAVLRRDRAVVAASLVVIAVLAWAYVFWLAASMGMPATPSETGGDMAGMNTSMSGMDMPGMDIGAAVAPAIRAWTVADFVFIFAMWSVMM